MARSDDDFIAGARVFSELFVQHHPLFSHAALSLALSLSRSLIAHSNTIPLFLSCSSSSPPLNPCARMLGQDRPERNMHGFYIIFFFRLIVKKKSNNIHIYISDMALQLIGYNVLNFIKCFYMNVVSMFCTETYCMSISQGGGQEMVLKGSSCQFLSIFIF